MQKYSQYKKPDQTKTTDFEWRKKEMTRRNKKQGQSEKRKK